MKVVAKRLGARYIVEGSVRREGDQVLVQAQLIDAENDVSLWSERYDRKLNNVFELQSAIALEIAHTLNATISREDRKKLDAVPIVVMEAYDNYVKARNLLTRGWTTYKRVMEALPLLEKAVEIDPDFVQGWALLSRTQTNRVERVREFDGRQDEVAEAERLSAEALEKAQQLDPGNVETLKATGYYYYIVKEDKVKGLKSFDEALEIFPNDSETLAYQAMIYVYLGQFEPAIVNLERAYAIDNANGFIKYFLSLSFEVAHRYDQLVPLLKHFLENDPEATHYNIQVKYYQFLLDGSLESFQAFEQSVSTVERTPRCDERTVQNNEMVVAMINNQFDLYAKAWMGKWDQHNKGHGNWSCPAQLNEEANHAHLLMQYGDSKKAEEIIVYAKNSSVRPINEKSLCIFNKDVLTPKLEFMSGDKQLARKEFDEVLPVVLKNRTFPRGVIERSVLLETADMVAPDYVYKLFKELSSEPTSLVSLETVCANPWTFPNLIKDPSFIKEIRKDGRFVKFLEHYRFLGKA